MVGTGKRTADIEELPEGLAENALQHSIAISSTKIFIH